jgi:hypothetical protein
MGTPHTPAEAPGTESGANLERVFLEAFLRARGHTLHSVQALPADEARQLLTEASIYASAHLAEVEIRAHFLDELHGAAQE